MFPCWMSRHSRHLSVAGNRARCVGIRIEHADHAPGRARSAGHHDLWAFAKDAIVSDRIYGGRAGQISAHADSITFGIWAVRGQEHGGEAALANAQNILADYNDYFGYRFPLPKLDSIAVPGGFTGAMENWGAITYNDQLLLLTPVSTLGDRQQVSASRLTRWHISGMAISSPWDGGMTSG